MNRPRGRPPKPEDEVLSERIEIRTTAEERAAFERAAEAAGMSLSQWMRERLLDAVERECPSQHGDE